MAASAGVIGAAPVHELVARLGGEQHVAGAAGRERVPQPPERVRIAAEPQLARSRLQLERLQRALQVPPAAAAIPRRLTGGEAELSGSRSHAGLAVSTPCRQLYAVDALEPAQTLAISASRAGSSPSR